MTSLRPTSYRRPRRRAPRALAVLLVLAAAGGAVYWFLVRDPAGATVAAPCPSPSPRVTAAPAPSPAAISVRVLNSTARNGLAQRTATTLTQRGFTVTQVGNAADPSPLPVPAQVRYGPAGAAAATVLAHQLLDPQLVPDARADATVDLVIGTAFQRLRTPAEVAAAVSPSPSPSAGASARCRAADG